MTELTMREMQQYAFNILKQVATICEEQGFRYTLAYGTLIGAIRHQGFIPWDDDIDIVMPRPDYDKFIAYCKENPRVLENLKLFNMDTCKDYPYMLTRISDSNTFLEVENEKSYGIGVFIDLYVLDGAGNTKDEAKAKMNATKAFPSLIFYSTRNHYSVKNTNGLIKKIMKMPAFLIAKIVGKEKLVKILLGKVDKTNYNNCSFVANLLWSTYKQKEILPKSIFEEYIDVTFEGCTFKAIKDYDGYLRNFYGNYMKLPPLEKRIAHHFFKAYKK